MARLTIGMASYKNFEQVYFTLQALRLYQNLGTVADTEILIVDNYGDDTLEDFITAWGGPHVRYVRYTERQGTAAPRDQVFAQAKGDWVMCIDSHVMLAPGAVARFREWCAAHPDCQDLIQGPMYYDDLQQLADSFNDDWAGNMWGTWRNANVSPEADPYEIPMMGLGLFACRRDSWLGFNKEHRGFGGEEGYIHTKYRQAGRKTITLPFLRWAHYFSARNGKDGKPVQVSPVAYALNRNDQIRNYLLGFRELGLDLAPIYQHFGEESVTAVAATLPPPTPSISLEVGMPFPGGQTKITNIQIDPNGICGSRCWFCPVRYIARPPAQLMPQTLFERLLDGILEGVKLGSVAENYTLWLSSYNDILLDPLLPERLAALRARGMRFACLTNGIGLLRQHHLLHEYRDVVVCYSVDLPAGNAESYAKHTLNPPATFSNILDGLRALHALDPAYYSQAVQIGINGACNDEWQQRQLKYDLPAGDTDRQLAELQAELPQYPRIEAMRPLCDRAGHLKPHAIDNMIDRPGTIGCSRLTEWIHVNSFGQAYTCCQDYLEEHKFADLTAQTIHQAWTTAPTAAFDATRKTLCQQCTFSK